MLGRLGCWWVRFSTHKGDFWAAVAALFGLTLATSDDGSIVLNENREKPPAGSKTIDKTPWSGDHQDIKEGIGAGPRDNVKIDPNDNVWGEEVDGSWTNHGPAGNFTGSGEPSGRTGKERKKKW